MRTLRLIASVLLGTSVSLIGMSEIARAQASSASPPASTEERLRAMEKKIKELEQRESEAFDRSIDNKGRVRAFLSDTISFGGYFESALTGLSGPDTSPQASAHSNTLGLNITAVYDDKTRFVSQILTGLTYQYVNPHNDFRMTPSQRQFTTPFFGALVAQAYSEMLFSEAANVQVGLGYVPFGYAFQLREPVLFRRRGGPQITQASSATAVGIAHPLWMGVNVHGSRVVDGLSRIGYSIYTHSPTSDTKTLGLGGRLWSTAGEDTTYGISVQNGSMTGGSYTSFGFDFDRHANWGGFVAEYAKNTRNDAAKIAESFYVEPYVNVPDSKTVAFLAVDYLDDPMNSTPPATLDPITKWIYGAGLNWLPITYARFRLGVFTHRYQGPTELSGGQRRDHESYEISSAVAF